MEGDNAALIAAGAQLASTSVNAMSAADTNKKQRQWQEKMYQQQRTDNLAQWKMQNEYNSPQAQMARYQEAGLNPNLIYGTGSASAGNSSAIPTSSPGTYNPKAPQIDLGSGIQAYQNVRQQQLQFDNLRAQNTVLTEEALLKKASRESLGVKTALDAMLMPNRPELQAISVQAASEGLRKLTSDADLSEKANYYKLENDWNNVQIGRQRLDNLKADLNRTNASTNEIKAGTALKNLELELNKQGVSQRDPIYFRAIARLLSGFGINLMDTPKKIYKSVEKDDY